MQISEIVGNKYKWTNSMQNRLLIDDPIEGPIGAGYVVKNRNNGNHNDIMIKEYHGLLILDGHGIYKDDHHEIEIRPGDFIQRLPDVKHSTISTDDHWNELYVVLGRGLYQTLLSLNILNNKRPVLHPGIDYKMIESFMEILDQISYADQLSMSLVPGKIIQYLSYITYMDRVKQTTYGSDQTLTIALKYMDEHQFTRISVQEVAEYVNIGYEKFRKLFQHQFGISPGSYMIQKRVNTAQELLSRGELSIKEISIKLGYTDTFTFSKQFKKMAGRTPSEFKALFLE